MKNSFYSTFFKLFGSESWEYDGETLRFLHYVISKASESNTVSFSLRRLSILLNIGRGRLRGILVSLQRKDCVEVEIINNITVVTLKGLCEKSNGSLPKHRKERKGNSDFGVLPLIDIPDFVAPDFVSVWLSWIEYKREIKRDYKSVREAKAGYNRLLKLSDNTPSLAADIVENCISNGWIGLYPLKTQNDERSARNNSVSDRQAFEDECDRILQRIDSCNSL